eukprot:2621744-Rhodomonas_salina.1
MSSCRGAQGPGSANVKGQTPRGGMEQTESRSERKLTMTMPSITATNCAPTSTSQPGKRSQRCPRALDRGLNAAASRLRT